jgi:protein-S-isoprenylcysteine O-methyltransferase Ste14
MSRRGPGGPIPPTLVYAAGFLLAWWLDSLRRFPVDGAGPSAAQLGIGGLLFATGLWLFIWGLVTFSRVETGIMLQQDATRVVEQGPYRYSRNPMYVGFTASYLGLALFVNAAWPIVVLPVVLIVLSTAVIAREERYMRTRFGADYEAYCRRVPRWL